MTHPTTRLLAWTAPLALLLSACSPRLPPDEPRPSVDAHDTAAAAAPGGHGPVPADGATVPAEGDGDAAGSRYTSLLADDCTLLERYEESGGALHRCTGAGGYDLMVHDSDSRMNVDVVVPDAGTRPLQLSGLIGAGAFSSLGPRAEWRMDAREGPYALILRFDVVDDPDHVDRVTSYLAVVRLTPGEVCAVARIAPGGQQNVIARMSADAVADKPCLRLPPGPGG